MTAREFHDDSHSLAPRRCVRCSCSCSDTNRCTKFPCAEVNFLDTCTAGCSVLKQTYQKLLSNSRHAARTLSLSEIRSRFAARLRTLRTSSLPVAFAWGVSCLGTYRDVRNPHAKPSDRMVARPTQWSKPFSPTSPTRFGLRTLRLRSPRFVAAAFVPLSAISADNENGRVSRSRSSLPRSCVVTPCETSRSFPGGNRRPF